MSGSIEVSIPGVDYDVVGSIVLYNTAPAELARAIAQFLAAPLRSHFVVVDNSPMPTKIPECDPQQVTYVFAGSNLGYGRGHNIAIRSAKGKSRYNLIMNTDIIYEPRAIEYLVRFMDERPSAVMVAPRILHPDGTLQHVCRLLPTPANLFVRRFLAHTVLARRMDEDYELRWWKHDTIECLPYFQGSFVLTRTEVCNQIDGFDERFFMYGEDIDLTRRLYRIGETLYVPDVSITHEYRRMSNHGWRGTWIGIRNNVRYFNKWGWFIDAERRRINESIVQRLKKT